MKKSRPRSRKPESWPLEFRQKIDQAISGELLIPFETSDRAAAFEQALQRYKRSLRDHRSPIAEKANALSGVIYNTLDVMAQRGNYIIDHLKYPLTMVLIPAGGFAHNLQNATLSDPALATEPHFYNRDENQKPRITQKQKPLDPQPLDPDEAPEDSTYDLINWDGDNFGE